MPRWARRPSSFGRVSPTIRQRRWSIRFSPWECLGPPRADRWPSPDGLRSRSKLLALLTGAASTIVAAGFGCLAGYLGNAIHRMSLPPALNGELSKSVVLHVAMLLTIGAGAGFSMGALMVGCWKAAASGLLTGAAAGFLAGAAFPVVTALLLPLIVTDMVVPDDPARMIWIGLALVLFGWTIPAFVRGWRSVGTA